MGEGIADVSLLAGRSAGETNYAVDWLDTGIRKRAKSHPRRPLEPAAKVHGVDLSFSVSSTIFT